jgi:hypothetical protein
MVRAQVNGTTNSLLITVAWALPPAIVSNPAPTAQASMFLTIRFIVCPILFYCFSQIFRATRDNPIRHAGCVN